MELHGIGIDVHLGDGEIRFESTSVSGKILLSTKTRSMLLADVLGLSSSPATALANGNLKVQTELGRTQVLFRKREGSAAQALFEEVLLRVPQLAGKAATGPLQGGIPKDAPRNSPELTQKKRNSPKPVDVSAEAVAARTAATVKAPKTMKAPKVPENPTAIDVSAEANAARKKALDSRPLNRFLATAPAPVKDPWSGSMNGVAFSTHNSRVACRTVTPCSAKSAISLTSSR